jgi:hypothetical protein
VRENDIYPTTTNTASIESNTWNPFSGNLLLSNWSTIQYPQKSKMYPPKKLLKEKKEFELI